MLTLIWLGVAILIGIYAQMGRGRTGAAWGFIAALLFPLAWVLFSAAASGDPKLADKPTTEMSVDILAGLVTMVVMVIIVWTLPDRRRARSAEGDA